MNSTRRRAKLSAALLSLLAVGLVGCREAQQAVAALPEYCRYGPEGPLCDSFDPAAIPYPVALGLRPLNILEPFDRRIVAAHIDSMKPRPRLARILAPVGPVPEGRRPYNGSVPQPLHRHGNPRLVLIAVASPEFPDKVDVHSVILVEDRVAASQRVAAGLARERLRGSTQNGQYRWGFSLADRSDSRGDLFLPRRPYPEPSGSTDQWAQGLSWHRIGADSPERKLDWFRSITNPGTCAVADVADRMMLSPVPQSWFEEYARTCPTHPQDPEFQRGRRQTD
ncbi:MAG TPA: hypothetical protein VE053_11735 [Allosphingosinicella sp.]|nr:hypothetical protein [Allosphingosinicella sp.]